MGTGVSGSTRSGRGAKQLRESSGSCERRRSSAEKSAYAESTTFAQNPLILPVPGEKLATMEGSNARAVVVIWIWHALGPEVISISVNLRTTSTGLKGGGLANDLVRPQPWESLKVRGAQRCVE